MIDRKQQAMQDFLCHRQAECLSAQQALQQEGRTDEAVFQRIRANVFELSQAVLGAACKQGSDRAAAFFLQRMEQIPANWEAARARAAEHGDTVQQHLEQLKLDAAAEIRAAFQQIWSEEA